MPWEFKSHRDLMEAGYVWRGEGFCCQPKCLRRILWYTNVDRKRVPIDPVTYQLHFVTCPGRLAVRLQKKSVIQFPSGGHLQKPIDFDGAA